MTSSVGPVKPQFLVKSKAESKLIPKTMKWLFLLLHAVFALDFGFINYKSPRMKLFVKLFYFTQASALTITIGYYLFYLYSKDKEAVWFFSDCICYFIVAVILLISNNTYYDFQFNLHVFDTEIAADSSSYKIQYKILAYILCLSVSRIPLSLAFCFSTVAHCSYPPTVLIGYYMIMIGTHTVIIVYTFLFTSVSKRIKHFTEFVRKENVDIIECHYLYKRVAEITEKTKETFDFIFAMNLLFNTIDATLTVYQPFSSSDTRWGFSLDMPLAYILVVQELVIVFSPAITAGLLASQVERLRLVLYDRLVKDQKHAKDLKRFISYIETRPLRFKVWTVIPLDWSLPIIVLNLCVTYLIVMIQFTQKD